MLYAAPGGLGPWWRAFWTAGMLAYLLHFWWAVFGVFQGDLGTIYDRQGFVAVTNALLTLLWIADVVVAWVRPWSPALWAIILRAVTWALVTVSFFLAAAVFRDEALPKVLGILLAVGVVVAWRVAEIRPRPGDLISPQCGEPSFLVCTYLPSAPALAWLSMSG